MFPGAGASVQYNEAGEPVSWDYPSYDEPADDADPFGDDGYYDEDEDEDEDGDDE